MSDTTRRKQYVHNPETGRRFVINGCMLPEPMTLMGNFQHNYTNDNYYQQFPPIVDLRQFMTRVEDQSQTSSW